MVRTRRGTKRISPNSAENESTDIAEKKPKLIPETCSKYFEKNVQSTSPDVKIEAGETATKENAFAITDDSNDSMTNEVLKQKSKKVLKIKDESDSDESSSDEFMKVPFSLDELGGFETLKKESNLPSKVNNTMLSSAMTRLSDDSGDEKETNEQNEYYDFSQIMESQEIISKTKKEQEEKANIKKTLPNNTKSKRQSGRVLKKSKAKPNHDIKSIGEELGITELLTMAEGSSMNSQEYSDSSDEEDSKEEVKTEKAYSVPEEGVQVTIELPNLKQKRKSKGFDLESAMKRRINLIKRENQVYIHKVHLLCWIAHGIFLNRAINNDDLMGLALSLIPSKHCYSPKHADLNYLDKLVEWFVKKVTVNKNNTMLNSSKISLMGLLESQINSRVVSSHRDLVLIFVCMVRSLGISARLVISLRPAPLRPPASDLCQINNKGSESKPNSESKQRKSVTSSKTKKETASKSVNVKEKQDLNHSSKKVSCARKSKNEKQPILKTSRTVTARKGLFKNETKSQNPAIQSPYFSSSDEVPLKDLIKNDLQSRKTKHLENEKTNESSSNSKAKSATTRKDVPKAKNVLEKVSPYFSSDRRTKRSVNVSYQDPGSSSSEDEVKIPKSTTKQKINKEPDKIVNGVKTKPQKKSVNTKRKSGETSDCDFEPPKASTSKKKSLDRRVLSSDEETIGSPKKIGNDFWAEVFLEAEEKWISVDLRRGKVHCIQQLYSGATQPVRYVVAWDNAGAMKDVTRRYAPQWMTVTRRQRVDESWWRETVVPYAPRPSHREREEDEDLDRQLHDKPLPTTVTEYKNHPLYALRRHLLKFEAIYPPDAPPLGFVRGEPVYSRGCVAELHTRETWIKEAKVVRRNEEPYKIVKARPKWDKVSQTVITDLPLPLFGHWQVEDYIPPPAVDGKVPRNEYGNVELYKPCMLPPGTVHLQVPQLARVARKLGIDCAPAVVGWEYSGGGSHPVLDGFIVCEESKDVLMDAWDKEMDESAKRAKEKVAARVYGNWKRLIRGLMIRERLKARYDFGVPVPEKKKKQQPKPSTSKS